LAKVADEYSIHAARLSKDIAQQDQAVPATTDDAALAVLKNKCPEERIQG